MWTPCWVDTAIMQSSLNMAKAVAFWLCICSAASSSVAILIYLTTYLVCKLISVSCRSSLRTKHRSSTESTSTILAPVLCVLIPLSGVDGAIVSGLLVCRRTPLCHCPNVRLPVKTAFQRLPVFHHNCTLARTTTRVHCSGCI